jgi:hypothetical protein
MTCRAASGERRGVLRLAHRCHFRHFSPMMQCSGLLPAAFRGKERCLWKSLSYGTGIAW